MIVRFSGKTYVWEYSDQPFGRRLAQFSAWSELLLCLDIHVLRIYSSYFNIAFTLGPAGIHQWYEDILIVTSCMVSKPNWSIWCKCDVSFFFQCMTHIAPTHTFFLLVFLVKESQTVRAIRSLQYNLMWPFRFINVKSNSKRESCCLPKGTVDSELQTWESKWPHDCFLHKPPP